MININEINEYEYEFANTVLLLHNALLREFSPISINDIQIEGEIDINSKLLTIANYYDSIKVFENEIEDRKEIAPDWKTALTQWITKLEDENLGEEEYLYYDSYHSLNQSARKKQPLINFVYEAITEGKNIYLYQCLPFLITKRLNLDDEEEDYIPIQHIKKIGFAVALAYKLPCLKQELKQIQQTIISPSSIYVQSPKQKINWTGTAGEFGAVMDLLIEKGYIEDVPVKKNKANVCYELFNIKTGKGELITDRYLLDCFGKDKCSFLPNEIKIPFSKNYGKDQITARKQNGIRAENRG